MTWKFQQNAAHDGQLQMHDHLSHSQVLYLYQVQVVSKDLIIQRYVNFQLQIIRPCSTTLFACIVIFPLRCAVNSTLQFYCIFIFFNTTDATNTIWSARLFDPTSRVACI